MLLLSVLWMILIPLQATAQCNDTHILCAKQLSKEDKKAGWNTNQKSESITVEKGKLYETTVTAYEGLEYRLSLCTDIDGGTEAYFQLSQDVMVTVTDSSGNSTIEKQRKIIFDNTTDHTEHYALFRSTKTEKFYVTVSVPAAGKSANSSLKNTDKVCVGVLLEHRRTTKSSL